MTSTLASDTTTRLLGTPGRMNDVHRALYRFRRSPMSILGAIMVGIILVLALVGPYIVPYPNDTTGSVDMDVRLQKPGAAHLFGTDDVGRDIFSRVIAGTRL